MSESARSWEGQTVGGGFALQQYLGGTANSSVFLTERDEKRAAIKLIAADPENTAARLEQLRQVATLSHENLLPLYESGVCKIGDAALIYAVMECADENLGEILPQRALAPGEVGEMLPPVLDALAYLHRKGFVHGHLRPANIFAVGDRVKISSDDVRGAGQARTTPSEYDAPETASGGHSAAADAWSVGVTLVQALTQQPPTWDPRGTDDPTVPREVPQPFFDIARNCLRRDALRRWTIANISARLRPDYRAPKAEAAPVSPRPAPRTERASSNWRHLAPAAVLILLALAVILVAPKVLNRLQGQPSVSATTEPAAAAEPEKAAGPPPTESATPSPAPPEIAAPAPPRVEEAAPAPERMGHETAPGDVARQVVPDVPEKARDTISGTVKVKIRVEVGPSGGVTDANVDSPGPSKYFAGLAMKAARQWKFTPAVDAEAGTREWSLLFEFTHDGAKVVPSPARR